MTDRRNPTPKNSESPVRAADLRALIVALGDGFFQDGLIELAQDAYIAAGARNRILAVANYRLKQGKADVAIHLFNLAKKLA